MLAAASAAANKAVPALLIPSLDTDPGNSAEMVDQYKFPKRTNPVKSYDSPTLTAREQPRPFTAGTVKSNESVVYGLRGGPSGGLCVGALRRYL